MKDEIKEILEWLEFRKNYGAEIDEDDLKLLLDYITNLQEKVNQYENPDDMTLFYMWLDEKAKDKLTNLQEEKDKYKLRCYKAKKMIFDNYGVLDKYEIEMLEDILDGKSDE